MVIIDAEWEELEAPSVKIKHKKRHYGWIWEIFTVVSLGLIIGRLLGLWFYGGLG